MKNLFKKSLAFLVSLALVLPTAAQPVSKNSGGTVASAATVNSASDFVIENGVLTAYKGSSAVVTIPSGVTKIGEGAFTFKSIQEVIISEGVTVIGKEAFDACSSLSKVTLPSTLTTIEKSAFNFCKKLSNIKFTDGITTIGEEAFFSCVNLKEVTLPKSVKTIGSMAFGYYFNSDISWDDLKLSGFTINGFAGSAAETYAKNNGFAFNVITEMPTVTTTTTTTTTATTTSTTTTTTTVSGTQNITDGVLVKYVGNEKVIVVPEGVASIGDNAFNGCSEAEKIVLPNSITSIGELAFSRCASLMEIVMPDTMESLGKNAFGGCASLKEIVIPDGITTINESVFMNCKSLTKVVIPESVDFIDGFAFLGCSSLEYITFPENVSEVRVKVDSTCGLKGAKILNKDAFISSVAFRYSERTTVGGAPLITYYKLDGLTIYGYTNSTAQKFATESGYTFVSLGTAPTTATVTTTATTTTDTTTTTTKTTTITTDTTTTTATTVNPFVTDGNALVKYNGTDKIVTVPDGITNIKAYAFQNCASIEVLVIPEKVVEIYAFAALDCPLKSVKILNAEAEIGVKSLGYYLNAVTAEYGKYSDFKIYGYAGSTAEKYSAVNGFEFILIDEATPAQQLGDFNGDGSVDAGDASEVLSLYALISTGGVAGPTDEQLSFGDVNSDGTVNASDASLILSYYSYVQTTVGEIKNSEEYFLSY